MWVAGREVVFKQAFLDELSSIERFLGRYAAGKGRAFTAAAVDFCCDIIAPFPFAFPVFQEIPVSSPAIRRAVFKRNYALIYQVEEETLRFLSIYHTSQNPAELLGIEE